MELINPGGNDHRGAAAGLEQAQEEREKEQLGLLGLDDLEQVLGGVLVVEAAGEGRIGELQLTTTSGVRVGLSPQALRRASDTVLEI